MAEKNIILPVSIVAAALIIVAGFGFFMMNPAEEQEPIVVQIPGYLEKTTTVQNSGSLSNLGEGVVSFAEADSDERLRLISVSGTVTKTASPELAYITLSIETLDKSASKSQSDNAIQANQVMAALENAGIAEDDIETSSYNVREEFEWNESMRKSVSVGYKTTNTIRVKVRDLDQVGNVIDVVVNAGANNISNVSFALTKETQAELRTMALKDASENARTKAQSIASGLGIGVGQVYSASESSSYATPSYARNYAMEDAVAGSAAPTPITPGDIEFSATVSVQFEIQ